MRIAIAFLASASLLSGCGSGASGSGQPPSGSAEPVLECAVDGASDYGDGCTIARAAAPGGTILTISSPTGSFRRLRVAASRVFAADGAEPARVIGEDRERVEVAIGGDRYRLPRQMLR
jgi:hypothetical protein